MDTEKYLKLQKKLDLGISPNDEGPYYHHAWWESYKGSIKGEVGGAIIGAVMGAAIGIAAAGILYVATLGTPAAALVASSIGLIIAGVSGAGLIHGALKFDHIGTVVGSGAAQHEQAEARTKVMLNNVKLELKNEIADLKSLIKSQKGEAEPKTPEKNSAEANKEESQIVDLEKVGYRQTHYAKLETPVKFRLGFWKIAAIGLVVGVAIGALLAVGGTESIAAGILKHMLGYAVTADTALIASTTMFGLFGASFGINRDIFRKIFDQTDLWFDGLLFNKEAKSQQVESGKEVVKHNGHGDKKKAEENGKQEAPVVATAVMPEGYIDYPKSSTFHRDRVLSASEKALLGFDHTRATPQ